MRWKRTAYKLGSDLILEANFWEASEAASTITDAFKELSRRAGERGERVVIKMSESRSPSGILFIKSTQIRTHKSV